MTNCIPAAGDQVAIGIAAELHARNDVVEALHPDGDPAKAIKAEAALARVDGLAERASFHEIYFFEVGRATEAAQRHAGDNTAGANGANFLRQTRLDEVAGFGALNQAQDALLDEAAHRLAHRSVREVEIAGHRENRESHAALPIEAAVPDQMRIDGAVDDREVQARGENIFQLLPDLFSVYFFVLHDLHP